MCADRGPTPRSAPIPSASASMRTTLPPAIASVRTSSVRSIVRCPPTRAGRICGCPRRMTEQSALVPPTSMKMPSVTFSCKSAPAIPAAGPESIVSIGRRATSPTSITPPSLRMIISGTPMPAAATAPAVICDVRTMRGKIAALSAAVRVRARRPCVVATSWPAVAAIPRSRASATVRRSARGRSTPNASLATMASTPSATSVATARSIAASSVARAYTIVGANVAFSASTIGGTRNWRRAKNPKAPYRPTMPTRATSPSSSAFVACVVECAMNAIRAASTPGAASARSRPATIPAATPSGASCVVGTLIRATIARVAASTTTTSVNVPPTSMPTRSALTPVEGLGTTIQRKRRDRGRSERRAEDDRLRDGFDVRHLSASDTEDVR